MSSCFGQTPNAGNIDSNRLWEIEQLVVDLPNDSIGALVGMPEEEQLKPKLKPQNDREKYSYFMEINPMLAEFQKKFELYPEDYKPKKNK